MKKQIFINYRRSLSPKDARLLQKALEKTFGAKRVFLDVDGLDGGDHWLHTLQRQVDDSAAMVVLIGHAWADERTEKGERRLDDPNDFVRFEIARALSNEIPVLPVLLDGAEMPRVEQLPTNLQPLVFTQAMALTMASFDKDADAIGKRLKFLIVKSERRGVPISTAALLCLAGLAAGAIAALVAPISGLRHPIGPPDQRTLRAEAAKIEAVYSLEQVKREKAELIAHLANASSTWGALRNSITSEPSTPNRKHLIESMDRILPRLALAYISFIDIEKRSLLTSTDAIRINTAIEVAMQTISQSSGRVGMNVPGRTLADTEANAEKLTKIFWDKNMDRKTKIDRIISDIMEPHQIDGLLWGQFHKKADGSINIRPIIISKPRRNFITESMNFSSHEFECSAIQNHKEGTICASVREAMLVTFVRLLKQL